MKRKVMALTAICLLLLGCLIVLQSWATASPDETLALTSSRVGSGGGPLNGGAFALNGTAGQPEAGFLEAGPFRLYEGFWRPLTPEDTAYLPLINRP